MAVRATAWRKEAEKSGNGQNVFMEATREQRPGENGGIHALGPCLFGINNRGVLRTEDCLSLSMRDPVAASVFRFAQGLIRRLERLFDVCIKGALSHAKARGNPQFLAIVIGGSRGKALPNFFQPQSDPAYPGIRQQKEKFLAALVGHRVPAAQHAFHSDGRFHQHVVVGFMSFAAIRRC